MTLQSRSSYNISAYLGLLFLFAAFLASAFYALSARPAEASSALNQMTQNRTAVLTFSKTYDGSLTMFPLPLVHHYVRYDITIKNTGNVPLENQLLWTHFVSTGGRTNDSAVFAIPRLFPEETTVVHLGPLKMLEGGEHSLFLGINPEGKMNVPDYVLTNYSPAEPVDSFMVFDTLQLDLAALGISAVAIGSGILAGLLIYRSTRATRIDKQE
jgi:hypothetical protein